MRTSKFSTEQIAQALRQAESGTPIVEICRELEVTEQTFYRWKRKLGEFGTPRGARAAPAPRREPEAQAARCRPEPRQDHPAGLPAKKC